MFLEYHKYRTNAFNRNLSTSELVQSRHGTPYVSIIVTKIHEKIDLLLIKFPYFTKKNSSTSKHYIDLNDINCNFIDFVQYINSNYVQLTNVTKRQIAVIYFFTMYIKSETRNSFLFSVTFIYYLRQECRQTSCKCRLCLSDSFYQFHCILYLEGIT